MNLPAAPLSVLLLTLMLITPLYAQARTLPLPRAGQDTLVTLTGLGEAAIAIELADGQTIPLTLKGQDLIPAKSNTRAFHAGPHFPEVLPDASLLITLGTTAHWGSAITRQLYIRPDPGHYTTEEQKTLIANWNNYPAASSHNAVLRIAGQDRALQFWIDGRFFTSVTLPSSPRQMSLTLQGSAQLVEAVHAAPLIDGPFTTVELPHYARTGDKAISQLSLPAGQQVLNQIPMRVAGPGQEINVGVARVLKTEYGPRTNYYDQYHMRTPFDGVPETIMLRVPNRPYSYGHFLCAVEHDPASAPVVSVRISRYFAGSPEHLKRGRGNAIAESELRLLDDQGRPLPHVTPVGQATLGSGKDARTATLYLARLNLNMGDIADLLRQTGLEDAHQGDVHAWGMTTDYLDVELASELVDWHPPTSNHGRRPLGRPSQVRVLGLTLENAPALVEMSTGVKGNHLYRHEKPTMQIQLTPAQPTQDPLKLAYTITGYHGQAVREHQESLSLASGRQTHTVDLSPFDLGWYRLEMTLTDSQGSERWREATTFVLLPPDTRKAKADSPFGTWWNKYYHLSEGDLNIIGPIYQKMGMRHTISSVTNHSFFGTNYSLEELAKYDMSLSQLNSLRLINRQRIIPEPLNESEARKEIAANLKQMPGVKRALVYHEHRLQIPQELEFPPELLGKEPAPLSETHEKRLELFRQNAIAIAKIYRDLAPDVKLYHGNSTRFAFQYMVYLRGRFPREYLDVLSLEHTAGPNLPESQPHPGNHSQVLWMLRELCKHYGYDDLPISASYENFNIPSDGRPGLDDTTPLHQQAQFYVRNMLHAMAFGVDVIHGGNVQDAGNAYYWTHWGSAGFNYRDLTPKPSFSAVATLTQLLDQAKYKRYLNTGSDSVYCLEFEREGKPMYVMWAIRERRPMTITLASQEPYLLTNMVGGSVQTETTGRELTFEVSPDPIYLSNAPAIEQIKLGQPTSTLPVLAIGKTLSTLENPADWRIVAEPDAKFETQDPGIPYRHGKVTLKRSQDPTFGPTTAVSLVPQPDVPPLAVQYVMLEPTRPMTLAPDTRGIAIQVKGNASWGRIHWELEDAQGREWKLTTDKMNNSSINFDGWRWIHIGLPERTAAGNTNRWYHDWTCFKGSSKVTNPELVHPVKIRRMVIELRTHLVYMTDLKPVRQPTIELKNLVTVTQ